MPFERAALLALLRALPTTSWPDLVEHLKATADGVSRPTAPLQLGLFPTPAGEAVEEATILLAAWATAGMRFLSLLDAEYPAPLRDSPTPPPFLFVRGELAAQDEKCVAVVGTRQCSEDGRRRAAKLGRALAECKVTVVSGLALGIDTAAHQGALAAPEGRTVAVVGTGLQTVYPPKNRSLQEQIARAGAVLSRNWPDFSGSKGGASFLARNRLMADLSAATVVVEASFGSGARSMAAYAQKRGLRVFLLRSLIESEEWARKMVETPNCSIASDVCDVLEGLKS